MKKLILIVLYKCNIEDAETVKSITLSNAVLNANDKIVLWDNSPEAQHQNQIKFFAKNIPCPVDYVSTPANISLAKIYNTIVEEYPGYDLVTFFDQDSSFSRDYFDKLKTAFENFNVNLFLPIIYQSNKIVSPATLDVYRGVPWKEKRTGLTDAKGKLAIMSGSSARFNYLAGIDKPFNERLKLYGIDTQFMLEYGEKNDLFCVLDYEMTHNMSYYDDTEPVEKKISRFLDHKASLKIIFGNHKGLLSINTYLLYKSLIMSLKYKSIKFLNND